MTEFGAKNCEICQKPASQRCSNCYNVYYCCKQHQKDGWKRHKKICRPFKLCEDDRLGRHLIATRPLEPHEIILEESPLIWGPSTDTIPICLGCGQSIDDTTSRPCRKCGWPVCNEICEKSPQHLPECQYTQQRGNRVVIKTFKIPHPTYQCITILRCLYQKQFLSKIWKKLEVLEAHDEERRSTKKYENDRATIAEFIRRFFKLTFSEDEIMQIVGIIQINSHEVPLTEPPHIAIYATASMFEHNCAANCTKSFTNSGKIRITAARKIAKDEHLSICYTDALWGTENRQRFLQETKFFTCHCERCQDPSEFQTNFSSLKCQNSSCPGFMLPESFLRPIMKIPEWTCNKCRKSISDYTCHDILERIDNDFNEIDKNCVGELMEFLTNYENYLHKNHYYFIEIKYNLTQILGQENGVIALTDDELSLKIQLCEELIGLISKIAVAEKRTLGLLLFELHAALMEKARRSPDNEDKTTSILASKDVLEQTVKVLQHEPSILPEGKVYQQALKNLQDLEKILNTHN